MRKVSIDLFLFPQTADHQFHEEHTCACETEQENGARSDRVVPRNQLTRGQSPSGNTHKKAQHVGAYPVGILPHVVGVCIVCVFVSVFASIFVTVFVFVSVFIFVSVFVSV